MPTQPSNEALVDLIYCGATDASALKNALTGLADQFKCAGAILGVSDKQSPGTQVLLSSGAWDNDLLRKYQEIAKIDPAPTAFAQLPKGKASTTNRILSPQILNNGVFVNEFFRPLGFQETLGATLFVDHSRFGLLGLHRAVGDPTFEDWEIARLEQFVPHLIRAVQLRRAFIEVEAKTGELQNIVERLEAGVALLNRGESVYFANRAARTVFNRGDGLTLSRGGRPVATHSTTRRKLGELISKTCRGGSGGVITIPTPQPGTAYAVLVAASSSNMRSWFGQPILEPGAVMLIHDPKSRAPQVVDVLQSALGLRPAAAKLVAALASDDNLQSYAEREGITINTARFHLRSALASTQTRTQAELMRIVVRMLRDLMLRDVAGIP